MSKFTDYLSNLKSGDFVRITQSNGQIIDGTVISNDNEDSLLLQINTTVMIRYQSVDGISISGSAEVPAVQKNNVPNFNDVQKQAVSETDKAVVRKNSAYSVKPFISKDDLLYDSEITENTLKQYFENLAQSDKQVFQEIFENFLTAYNEDNEDVLSFYAAEMLKLSESPYIADYPKVNRLVATVCGLAADYDNAVRLLYYANNLREACITAFNAAYRLNEDVHFYSMAGAAAVMYISSQTDEQGIVETASCLREVSIKCKDVSGIVFLDEHCKNDIQTAYTYEVLKKICDKLKISFTDTEDVKDILSEAKSKYSGTYVYDTVIQLEQDKMYYEQQKKSKAAKAEKAADTSGRITKLNFLRESGQITALSGNVYEFAFNDIPDSTFRQQILKGASRNKEISLPVTFETGTRYKKAVAFNIKKKDIEAKPVSVKTDKSDKSNKPYSSNNPYETDPNKLFTNKQYEKALAIRRQQLKNGNIEEGFAGAVNCLMALYNQNKDKQEQYISELRNITELYGNMLPVTIKSYMALISAYEKLMQWQKVIEAVNRMDKENVFDSLQQKFHFLVTYKAGIYKRMADYEKALAEYLEIERFIEKNKMYEKVDSTCAEICELYITLGNYDMAKYYFQKAKLSTKASELKLKLDEWEKEQKSIKIELPVIPQEETEEETVQTDENDDIPDNAVSDDTSDDIDEETDEDYEIGEYRDEEAFEKLISGDKNIIDTALAFGKERFDCTVTYLAAAAEVSRLYGNDMKSAYSEMTAADMIVSVSELINTAFGAYGFRQIAKADELIYHYQNCCFSVPEISDNLLMAAALRMSFADRDIQSFEIDRLMSEIEKISSESYKTAVISLARLFGEFSAQTGYCMDMFADYNTNSKSVQNIIASAEECQRYIEQRVKSYESQGQVRRARKLILNDDSSIISTGLRIVCNNEINKASKLRKDIIEELLYSDNVSGDNIDTKKLDDFIDKRWDEARNIIISEKRNVRRPHDNLKSGKRNNIIIIVRRAVDCICRWLNAVDDVAVTKNVYSLNIYKEKKDAVTSQINMIINQIKANAHQSFDLGRFVLLSTAEELLDKIDGSYDFNCKKYTSYSDFLKTNHVLLNENFVPEINSTFSDLYGMDIFSRIKAFAEKETLPEFGERIKEIFSDNIHNSNFRCADLIRQYGEYFRIEEITDNPLFDNLNEWIKSSKNRTAYFYEDFKNELELDESYGSISDVSGYKTFVAKNIDIWYAYAVTSCDFGFFSDIMEAYRKSISENAESKAQKLAEQLADLAADKKYDFGVYDVQQIRDHIEERNFAIAENILNCIRRNDTKNIADFTEEPRSIFDSFMAEYDTLYRAVSDTKVHLQKSLTTYYGKKNVETVLRRVTNNMNKDVRNGISLINSWPVAYPAGVDNISKFVSLLGFTNAEVVKDNSFSKEDIYLVKRKKQTGRVTYPHPIPAFGSLSEEEGIRVVVLYGRFDTDRLIDKFCEINTVSKNTIVLLDSVLAKEERRRFARKIKEEKNLSKSFIVIDRVLLFYFAKHYQSNTIGRMLMATTMPFSFNQPFCPKPSTPLPGELFTGRKEELNLIEKYDGVNLVYGGRQLGKSSLLKMAEHNIDKNASGDRAVVINIKERDYTEAARKVSRELIMNDILPEDAECDDWDTLTMYIGKRLKNDTPNHINYLLIMLDEADVFIESCRDVKYRPITALKDMLSPRFKFVLAGLHNLSKYDYEAVYSNNSDIAHLESLVVRPFKRPEATELLTNALGYLGFVFSDDIINLILAKTNYFPGLIHLYGQKLLAAMTNDDYAGYSETETPYYYVTDNHIKKVLADQSFKDEIKNKLVMTLEVNGKQDSPYYIIALLMAYIYYEEMQSDNKTEFTVDDIMEKASGNGIGILLKFTREQIAELLHEMWDLNILSCKDERYMFSTDGFRELLGTREEVNNELTKYIGGNDI